MQEININEVENVMVNLTIDLEDACLVIDTCVDILEDVVFDKENATSILRILSKSLHHNALTAGDLQTPIMQMKKIIDGQPNEFFG